MTTLPHERRAIARGLCLALSIIAGLVVLTSSANAAPADADEVSTWARESYEASGFPGLTYVAVDGEQTVSIGGFGADASGAPLTADSPMRAASLTKSVTAVAALMLVDDGLLDLDEPVTTYLPGLKISDDRLPKITTRMLLTQTSGLRDGGADLGYLNSSSSLEQYVDRLEHVTLLDDPGSSYSYCNINFEIAGRIIEVLRGQSLDDYLRKDVFTPLGMTASNLTSSTMSEPVGYQDVFGVFIPRDDQALFTEGSGSAGLVTTARDLAAWLTFQSSTGAPLLTAATMQAMHETSDGSRYAMGWFVDDSADPPRLWHNGMLFTWVSEMMFQPSDGRAVAVLANGNSLTSPTFAIADGMLRWLNGERPDPVGSSRLSGQLMMLAATIGCVALLSVVAIRARRWAHRRQRDSRLQLVLRCLPLILPLALVLALRPAIAFLTGGRTLTWAQLTYYPAPLLIGATAMALAGLIALIARLIAYRRLGLGT